MKCEYILNHYQFYPGPDGVFAEGRLHGRPGYPEGTSIQTSYIIQYSFNEENLLIETANSIYRCPLSGYIAESCSAVYLTETVPCKGQSTAYACSGRPSLIQTLASIEQERTRFYKDQLKDLGYNSAIIRYHGCDSPYIEWVALTLNGQTYIRDNANVVPESSTLLMLGDAPFSITCSAKQMQMRSDALDLTGACTLFIENAGDQALFFCDNNGVCRTVAPGKILSYNDKHKVLN